MTDFEHKRGIMGKIGEELAEQREKGDDQAPEDSGGQKRAVGASNTRIDHVPLVTR